MGPSRWGKSTLLNVLGCLERPASREVSIGRVHVMHKDSRKPAATPPPQNRVCLSKLLTAHYPELSCNVMLPRMFTREKDSLIVERATTLLELVGKKRMSRKPGVLSALTTTIAAHGVFCKIELAKVATKIPHFCKWHSPKLQEGHCATYTPKLPCN